MLTQLPARRCWINAAKRRLCVWPNSSSTQSPLVSSINSKSTPDFSDRTTRSVVLSNHSTGSGGEERTSGLRPETLTSTAHGIFSLGLLLQTDIRKSSNRDVSKSHSVRTRVRIFSHPTFQRARGVRGPSRNVKGRRRQRHKTYHQKNHQGLKFRHAFPLRRPGTSGIGCVGPAATSNSGLAARS